MVSLSLCIILLAFELWIFMTFCMYIMPLSDATQPCLCSVINSNFMAVCLMYKIALSILSSVSDHCATVITSQVCRYYCSSFAGCEYWRRCDISWTSGQEEVSGFVSQPQLQESHGTVCRPGICCSSYTCKSSVMVMQWNYQCNELQQSFKLI